MKRLPDEFDEANPIEAYAAALLKEVHPLAPSAARKRRVWNALQRSGKKRPRTRTTGPVVAGLLLCAATAASATMPHLFTRLQRAADAVTRVDVTASPTTAPHRAPPSAPMPPRAVHEPRVQLVEEHRIDPAPVARRKAPSKSHAIVADSVDSPASAALMVEAMHERRAGHLARALELSSEYRFEYPNGPLGEEALALSIEAAAALGDENARGLSALYLQRYARGRFRVQALRVMGSTQ